MKHIYILDEYQTSKRNGIGSYLKELIYCLQYLRVTICIISFNSDQNEFNILEKEDGIKYMYFPVFPDIFPKHSRVIEKIFRLYIEDSSDNLFFFNHFPCENLLKTIKLSYPLSTLLFVIHDQGWTALLRGDIRKLQEIIAKKEDVTIKTEYKTLLDRFETDRKVYRAADGVICLNDDTYKLVKEVYKKQAHVYRLKHGCRDRCGLPATSEEKQKIKEKLHLDKDEKILLYTGRLSKLKGTDILINSFRRVVKEIPEVRLVLAGSLSDKEYILRLAKEVTSKISFTGHLSQIELKDWYTIADVGVFPSYIEQCSFTGIEMMMYGLPIIASDSFGVRCMFIEGVNAKIAGAGNSPEEYEENLTNALRDLLQSESMRITLGKKAREMYETTYAIENMQREYNNLFSLLNKAPFTSYSISDL